MEDSFLLVNAQGVLTILNSYIVEGIKEVKGSLLFQMTK